MKTILFVCLHNSGRSQIAEAFFNKLAAGKAQAYSAGTQPADKVNPVVVEAMKEVGIDIRDNKPKALTLEMVEQADRMITMGCGAEAEALCPASFIETEDWVAWLIRDLAAISFNDVGLFAKFRFYRNRSDFVTYRQRISACTFQAIGSSASTNTW